ncbi:hypothetical protein KAK07_25010 [Ideonella sp. 4Y16]|uniref:hypothetical protein n=1 Tax=Ideonella alba TaxID=2824118 RepID=UPI001B35B3E9|nr:hypothetical protein [Ideonella alba]MBQ0946610.1 hypothetical protein [Ideonella alba]
MPSFEESFCAAEERALCFLVDSHGFRAIERTVTPDGSDWTGGIVRYRCEGSEHIATPKGWMVSLAYAPRRLELSLDISDEHGSSFSVEELHAIVASDPFPRGTHSLYDSLHDEEAQFTEFNRLAGVLKLSGARFFAGDRSLWLDLRTVRERSWQAEEDRRAVARSELAFHAKEWRQVVAELEPREGRLSKATNARLAYARNRLKSAA